MVQLSTVDAQREQLSRKRGRAARAYGFHTFADPGCPLELSGAFRDNVRQFLQECGEAEDYAVEGMPTWKTILIEEASGVAIPLYVVEEHVSQSFRPHCDYCRCSGWSHHFVSKRRYHFIIPRSDSSHKPLGVGGRESTEATAFDRTGYLLHGMVHCNGFGHLITINGREKGSKYVSGREIMDLWDRICNLLRTREVTVDDVAKKRGMELRLLYNVAYGRTWFGRWGYSYGHGSFGVTETKYATAVEILGGFPLPSVLDDFRAVDNVDTIRRIVRTYQRLSDTTMLTVRDLLRFMLELRSRFPVQPSDKLDSDEHLQAPAVPPVTRKSHAEKRRNAAPVPKLLSFPTSRWSDKRLRYAADVIVDALLDGGGRMSRQAVRDAARLTIGDTGLLDFVLKSLNECIIGKRIIRRRVNSATRVLEYTVEEFSSSSGGAGGAGGGGALGTGIEREPDSAGEDSCGGGSVGQIGLEELTKDIIYFYKHVVENYWPAKLRSTTEAAVIQAAARAILDTKRFVKSWPFFDDDDSMLRFLCSVVPGTGAEAEELSRPLPPPEVVVVPLYATVGDLKREVEKALRDTYYIAREFVVVEVEVVEGKGGDVDNEEPLFGVAESGARMWVRGRGLDLGCGLRYEGGADNWVVDCSCGARDDDGERMIACDVCEVWQHTRCGGIGDGENTPVIFFCEACGSSLMPRGILPLMDPV
ncbi:PHD finger protein MALE MEIOCYTE DEATH 1-like [Nymphaea colorata]|nr:PHD finger protein MALE MEIOCYTE DEATH 1-like [Nymphaea colorata]